MQTSDDRLEKRADCTPRAPFCYLRFSLTSPVACNRHPVYTAEGALEALDSDSLGAPGSDEQIRCWPEQSFGGSKSLPTCHVEQSQPEQYFRRPQ